MSNEERYLREMTTDMYQDGKGTSKARLGSGLKPMSSKFNNQYYTQQNQSRLSHRVDDLDNTVNTHKSLEKLDRQKH